MNMTRKSSGEFEILTFNSEFIGFFFVCAVIGIQYFLLLPFLCHAVADVICIESFIEFLDNGNNYSFLQRRSQEHWMNQQVAIICI